MDVQIKKELFLKEMEDDELLFDLGDFLVGVAIGLGIVALAVLCTVLTIKIKRKFLSN